MTLKTDAKAARTAADKSVAAGDPPERQVELAQKACDLELKLEFAEWVKLHEDQGYTVEGDSFTNATVVGIPEGPTYDEEPGK